MAAKVDKNKLEKFKKGQIKFGQLFSVSPKHVAALANSCHALFAEGKLSEAERILEGLSVLDSRNPYVHALLGAIHQRQEKWEVALERYSLALEIFPDDLNSLTNRGEIYLRLGKFQQASDDLKKAIDLDPERKHPSANRARLLVGLTAESLKDAKEKGAEAVAEALKRINQMLA